MLKVAAGEARPRFTFAISTMGCKANLTDSQALEASLRDLGGAPASQGENADLFLLNTCTVTDQADREAAKILRGSKAPLTVATGCLAEVDPERLASSASSEHKVRIVRNSAKEEVSTLVEEWLRGELSEQSEVIHGDRAAWHQGFLPNRDALEIAKPSAAPRTRAFLKVQDGCNAFCAYCIIPFARGRSRSLSAEQVAREVGEATAAGAKEVVLTAIHAADYESQGLDFTGLVEKVLRETAVPRLRLTSLDPAEIPDRLLSLMENEPRLCPHFHVSLQSANARVLGGMKRGYGAEEIEDRLSAIARRLPHAYVGMDLIAGFPGETAEEFEDGYRRLERLPWTKAHVFPFSVRRNTAAARLVEAGVAVPEALVRERAARLRELSDRKQAEANASRVGSVMEVLIEGKEATRLGRAVSIGHSRSYFKVVVPGRHPANELRRVRIVGVLGLDELKGELV
jgi:threonylcarbamoyladenosine tRNA methylthiotransferase MtaB